MVIKIDGDNIIAAIFQVPKDLATVSVMNLTGAGFKGQAVRLPWRNSV